MLISTKCAVWEEDIFCEGRDVKAILHLGLS